jgi:hypothetical protein
VGVRNESVPSMLLPMEPVGDAGREERRDDDVEEAPRPELARPALGRSALGGWCCADGTGEEAAGCFPSLDMLARALSGLALAVAPGVRYPTQQRRARWVRGDEARRDERAFGGASA